MKTLVINQPFVPQFCRTQRWPARTRGRAMRPPDWLAYATAVLEKAKMDVELYDFPAAGWDKVKFRQLIKEKQPDFVVLDSTTPSIYSDIECAKSVKEAKPSSKVIMVGAHATVMPEETIRLSEGSVDVIALGEYDYTVKEIIDNSGDFSRVHGIAYLESGNINFTETRLPIENLDELPFPAWQHLDIKNYYDASKLYPYLDIIAGRGCPFGCSFCQLPQLMFGNKYRLRSAKNIVDEMEYDLKLFPSLRRGEFFFEDDTFTANKKRAWELCEEILKRNLIITWSANARTDLHGLELFKLMKRAGFRMFIVGFESGSQKMLDRMGKKASLEDSIKFMEVAKKARLDVHGCFVLGLSGETKETMRESIDFAKKLDLNTVQFSGAVPLPGTEFFNYCKDNNLLKAKSWDQWLDAGEQAAIVDYPHLKSKEINYYVDKGLKEFYFRPSFIIKFIFHTRSLCDFYRKLRGAVNFIKYLLFKK